MQNSHVDVTIDFTAYGAGGSYDLRIPVQVSVKQLLLDVAEILKMGTFDGSHSAIKVITKSLVLADDDMLLDYPVTDGDILTVLR